MGNPRTFEYLLEGIAWALHVDELERLEEFARAHFTGAALKELEAAIAHRRAALEATPRPSRRASSSVAAHLPLERMMDDIAAATSGAELDYLQAQVDSLFAEHPQRAELERAIAGMRRRVSRALGA